MRHKNLADRLVAHRGYMHRCPENTLPSLKAALDAGAAYIEFDLQMNKDHDLVVIHDDSFIRTAGIDQSVFDCTSAQCLEISVHYPKLFSDTFNPTPVFLLQDLLELLVQYPNASAMVEIKRQSLDYWGLELVMGKLLAQLKPHHAQCVLISFSVEAIEYTQQHSDLQTGWIFNNYDDKRRQRAASLGADFLITNHKGLPKGQAPWPEFKRWMLYDIMRPELAIEYSEMGVELIETADIKGLRDALTA